MSLANRRAMWSMLSRAAATAYFLHRMPGTAVAAEAARSIAVLHPDVGEPFRSAFMRIIDGVEERTGGRVTRLAIGNEINQPQLADELRRHEIRVVIALGRNGLKAASGLDTGIGVIAGCVLSVPDSQAYAFPIHTLAPDPALLFDRLLALMPSAKRVWVVYDPRQNAWLIRLAREAAKSRGLDLQAQEASDLAGALRLYQQIMTSADARRDALWLAQDSTTVDDSTVFPLLLKQGWERNLAVFSSNAAHVKRGALFALYPDNASVGRALGQAALQYLASPRYGADSMLPMKEVLGALNTRTAGHLGLSLGPAVAGSYALIYPEP